MYRNKLAVGATFLAALMMALFGLMLPVPASWKLPTSVFYIQLVGYSLLACLHVGAAVLFTMNLDVYKAKLRRAYIAIAAGIILTAVGALQVPVIGALNAWQSDWVQHGGLVAPLFFSSLTLYLATQYLAKLIKIKHLLTTIWLVLPLAVSLGILSSALPHVETTFPPLEYAIALGSIAWSTSLLLCAAILVFAIRQHAGAHYTRAMTWLAISLFNSFLILAIQYVYTLTATDSTGPLAQLSTLLAVASGFLWLRAGYAFALTKEYEEEVPLLRSFFGQPQVLAANHPKTVVDMVTYAAGLVSNADDIDPLLDEVRAITSKLKPGAKLSSEDTTSLIKTYLKVENYLTTKEAIRNYTQKELRAQFDLTLQKLLATHKTQEVIV